MQAWCLCLPRYPCSEARCRQCLHTAARDAGGGGWEYPPDGHSPRHKHYIKGGHESGISAARTSSSRPGKAGKNLRALVVSQAQQGGAAALWNPPPLKETGRSIPYQSHVYYFSSENVAKQSFAGCVKNSSAKQDERPSSCVLPVTKMKTVALSLAMCMLGTALASKGVDVSVFLVYSMQPKCIRQHACFVAMRSAVHFAQTFCCR